MMKVIEFPPPPAEICDDCYADQSRTRGHRQSDGGVLFAYCQHSQRGALLQLRLANAGWRVYPAMPEDRWAALCNDSALAVSPPANSQSA